MKLAAIDIGSNAVRLQITKVIEYQGLITFKKLEYIRFPLRLGHDVFTIGKISAEKEGQFMKLMQAFKNIIDLYDIQYYYACATSAMRESSNGENITRRVKNELGIEINIISGYLEAEMVNRVIALYLDEKPFLHIDVGGGSTELSIYLNREKILSESFNIGSVRSLEFGDYAQSWRSLLNWINDHVKKQYGKIIAIGTGGNIGKVYELSEGDKRRRISIETVEKVRQYLAGMSMEDKLNKLQLNPDRADVIVPATDIYLEIMRAARAKTILVPDVGLKDGINYFLYEKYYPNKGKVAVKN